MAVLAIVQAILATCAAAFAYVQIQSAKTENRKWKTLDICAEYEFNAEIAAAVARLRKFYALGAKGDDDPEETVNAAKVILNYLDGIAIGVVQGLYIEDLAKDHLRSIVRTHIRELFGKGRQVVNEDDFDNLIAMNAKWAANEPFYKANKWWW
jgi:hypothetical protein